MSLYLLTAGTGKVGRELTEQLTAAGHQVRVASRSAPQALLPDGATGIAFDYNNRSSWPAALEGVDGAFFVNVGADTETIMAFIAEAAAAGVRRGVLMTALGVENLPESAPPRVLENALMQSGMEATVVRPTWFMQNFTSGPVGAMVQKGVIALPAENGATSFIDARDIAAVAAAALTQEGHSGAFYGVTGGEALNHTQVAAILGEAMGRPIRYEAVDADGFVAAMGEIGAPAEFATMLGNLYGMVRAGYTAGVLPTVEQVTGRPPITFAQFARDSAAAANQSAA
jgi:uncharacterized protein YbjT (DUF2867 family)